AEDGIRDRNVTGVQTCALPIYTPDISDYEFLSYALTDEKVQIRRMAVSLLAMIEKEETLNYLKDALQDKSVTVRRTAGDAYSDLGFKSGLKDMYPLLNDKSPIVS